MIFILGGHGFLGSALVRHCVERGLAHQSITRQNYSRYLGRSCDLLVNAAGNSRKYLARERPLEDFELSVGGVRASLEDFHFSRYLYLSSADVYPDSSSAETTREDQRIEPQQQTPYGFHKYLAEQCARHRAREWLILRVSGCLGPGLRKNPVYDLLEGLPLWVEAASEFQYLHTADLARIVFELAELPAGKEVINVGGRGVMRMDEVARLSGLPVRVRQGSPRVRCELDIRKLASYCAVPETGAAIRRFLADHATGRTWQPCEPARSVGRPSGRGRA